MDWILLAVTSYVLLALVALGDRKLLSGPMPDPKVYAFYVGILGSVVVLATPVLGFPIPTLTLMAIAAISGALFILGAYALYYGLHYFEAVRIVPATGALVPIFTLLFSRLLFPDQEFSQRDIISFVLLVAGIPLLTYERTRAKLLENLVAAASAAWLFGSSFALAKYVYDAMPFWDGFLWMRIGGGLLAVLFFLFFPSIRTAVLAKRPKVRKKRRGLGTAAFFLLNQAMGAAAVLVQNGAVALAPSGKVAFVNALQGIQYVVLFIVEFISNSRIDLRLLALRAAGVAMVGGGLALLAFK